MFKPAGETDDLWGFIGWNDGSIGKYIFENAQEELFDGQPHTVIFTSHGSCNASGVPANAHLFIDGVRMATAHVSSTPNPGTIKHIANVKHAKKLTLFADHNGNNRMPKGFYFSSVHLFRQYMGGSDSHSTTIREFFQKVRIAGDHPSGAQRPCMRVMDLAGKLVEDYWTGHDSFGGTEAISSTIVLDAGYGDLNNVKYLSASSTCIGRLKN